MATQERDPVEPAGKMRKQDLVLALGLLAAVLAISVFLVFGRGETAVAMAILWGWIVEVAIWLYVFLTAI